jgi:tetratricopeptide (TPR) repeat protein
VSGFEKGGRLLCGMGATLFSLALAAGVVQSLRSDRRLPAVDLFASGAKTWIDRLISRQDYRNAIGQLELQTRLLPFDAPTREELGILLGNQSRPREARAQFEELVRLRPHEADGYYYVGSTYLDTNQPALAIPWFQQAVGLKPDFPLAHNQLGLALASIGKLHDAELCFARAVELSPDDADARSNLERARRELGGSP